VQGVARKKDFEILMLTEKLTNIVCEENKLEKENIAFLKKQNADKDKIFELMGQNAGLVEQNRELIGRLKAVVATKD